MKCKECKQEVVKEPVSRGTITRYVDEKGQLWNGAKCPNCYRIYNKERMRITRSNKHEPSGN